MGYSRMPKTRKEYEYDLLNAFRAGMISGYAIEHTNLTEDENNAVLEFAKSRKFKTDAVQDALYK